jgi:hypothetical protein
VAGDAGTQEATVRSPLACNIGTPLSAILEEPATQEPRLLPAMELPQRVLTPEFPEPLSPITLSDWVPEPDHPQQEPAIALSELPPPMGMHDWLAMEPPFMRPLHQTGCPRATLQTFGGLSGSQQEKNGAFVCSGGVQGVVEKELSTSAALESILEFESGLSVNDESGVAGIAPPTRADIEMSLSGSIAPPSNQDCSIEPESDVEMTDANIQDLVMFAIGLLDENWEGYTEWEGGDGVE